MQIFCRETEAHLEVHPHVSGEDKSTGGLITPDLWLKNCKSPDSRTPSPAQSPRLQEGQPKLPLITIASPSKLMATNDTETKRHNRYKIQKKHRKRQTISYSVYKTEDLPQDLRVRHPLNEKQSESIPSVSREGLIEGCVKHTDTYPVNHPMYNNPRFYQPKTRPLNTPHLNVSSGLIRHPADLPPVTVLVPYPIVVPFPVPIPIPIPLGGFIEKQHSKVNDVTDEISKADVSINTKTEAPAKEEKIVENFPPEDDVKNGVTRPLRKRKRLLDSKPRIVNKKKQLAV